MLLDCVRKLKYLNGNPDRHNFQYPLRNPWIAFTREATVLTANRATITKVRKE